MVNYKLDSKDNCFVSLISSISTLPPIACLADFNIKDVQCVLVTFFPDCGMFTCIMPLRAAVYAHCISMLRVLCIAKDSQVLLPPSFLYKS